MSDTPESPRDTRNRELKPGVEFLLRESGIYLDVPDPLRDVKHGRIYCVGADGKCITVIARFEIVEGWQVTDKKAA